MLLVAAKCNFALKRLIEPCVRFMFPRKDE